MPAIKLAVVDGNRLSCMGLQSLLHEIIPMAEVCVFVSFEALEAENPDEFKHFFVSSAIYFEHAAWFQRQAHRSIVLVQDDNYPHMAGLMTLNVSQDEVSLVRDILRLRQCGHAGTLPPVTANALSPREAEVAILLAKGYINKEIAEKLHISLTTVITHRKNIMERLQARSLADIVVYVVMHGMVNVESLT